MKTVEKFGRIQLKAPSGAAQLTVHTPSAQAHSAITFIQQDYTFSYDKHGYEEQTAVGAPYCCARYTPMEEGEHIVRDERGEELERFCCTPSAQKGYVGVSPQDSRYFSFSDGGSYIPVGLNLVGCGYDRQPAGSEHFAASNRTRTTGLIQWRRWFDGMQAGGANYARVWLSNPYTQARTEIMGTHDLAAFARLDRVMDLARERGVRVKMCLEHFRTFLDATHFAYKRVVDPDTGKVFTDVEAWFNQGKWNERWLADIRPYLARYQNDPVVFAWELWNEIDCGDACFDTVERFTRRMLPKVKAMSPMNMVVNSLGSFDEEQKQAVQDAFASIPDMEFLQVHRYLDQGAPLAICGEDPVAFSLDAVDRCATGTKPLILTETGAVNDRHVGPFRFYNCDHDGLIFTDVTYPPFFAGAAGSGHIWHWDNYVDAQNLWAHFRPLSAALEDVQADQERFSPFQIEDERAWVLGLRGSTTTLLLVRNRLDRWDHVLRDGQTPAPIEVKLALDAPTAQVYWLKGDDGSMRCDHNGVVLSGFVHGCIVKIRN